MILGVCGTGKWRANEKTAAITTPSCNLPLARAQGLDYTSFQRFAVAVSHLIWWMRRGCSSVVEHNLAKVGVEGSNPFTRSNFANNEHVSH